MGHTFPERRRIFTKQKLYLCRSCGNLVALLRHGGAPLRCCGKELQELLPATQETGGEKHIPVCETANGVVHVTVGATAHPMTDAHHIEWIWLETRRGVQYARPAQDGAPQADFALCPGDEAEVAYALCNQHELWRNDTCH